MSKDKNENGQNKGGLFYKLIGVAVLILVILLIVLSKSKSDDNVVADDESSEMGSNGDNALHVAQQVVAGDYTYEFSGVKWIFDTESAEVAGTGQTWLKLEFADFTRNGNAISFGRPYKLGVHPGTCEQTDFIETPAEAGIPLSYAVCEGAGVKREFAVLQNLENVIVVMRETKGEAVGDWQDWYNINVTEIVR